MNDLQVTRLCDLSNDANSVTSVSWSERGNQVAVGTHHGYVTVWDVAVNKQVSQWRVFIRFECCCGFIAICKRKIKVPIMSIHVR